MQSNIKLTLFSLLIAVTTISCGGKDDNEKQLERERAKVGNVYNPDYQGIKHENHNNQFPVSRNNDNVNNQLAAGVSDTTNVAENNNPENDNKQATGEN